MKHLSKFTAVFIAMLMSVISLCQICYGAEMTYKNGMLEVSGLDGEATAICASYDTNKTLTGIKITEVTNGTNNLNAKDGDKIFLWQSLIGIKPLSEAVTVPDKDEKNILIVYFSRAGENWQVGTVEKGNTAVIADYIKEKVDADVFEISPAKPYPENYMETVTIANEEKANNARPEFKGKIENFEQYDTVFLGYPIWHSGLPMIMYTFLEEYDMSGKTIIPFSTHGGSGWGSTRSELKKLCPDSEFIDGFSTAGTNARNAQGEVEKWLEGLDIEVKESSAAPSLLYQGHASMRIKTAEGKIIYIDPYAGTGYDVPADLILVTHGHMDHTKTDLIENRNSDCRIITYAEALDRGTHKTFDLDYVTVEAVEAGYNEWHDVKECVGYILTFSNGISIYVTGDTAITQQMPQLADKNIDYAFFCCDDVYTMTMKDAIEAAGMVKAKNSIPYHMKINSLFDRTVAEQFAVDGRLIVQDGEEIELK